MTRSSDSEPAKSALPPGYRLHWYELQSVLGSGGFGITYLGRDTNLNQSVAIKEYFPAADVSRGDDLHVLPREGMSASQYRAGLTRFLNEARLLARFRHPHIVRVLSVFESLGTAFIVMELERGRSLGQLIRGGRILTDRALLDVVLPLLDGLDLVHQSGFIHRDIKPSNVVVRSGGGGPVLIDFGAARHRQVGVARALTAIVSRGFAPFEQYDVGNDELQGPWTDIYAMAATMYDAMTGGPPVDTLSRATAIINHDPDPLVPAAEIAGEGFSAELARAVDAALAFRARDRPQSITEWAALFPAHSRASAPVPGVLTEALEPPGAGGGTAGSGAGNTTVLVSASEALSGEAPAGGAPAGGASSSDGATRLRATLAAGGVLEGRSVAVVDDERASRALARRVLERFGAREVHSLAGAPALLDHLKGAGTEPDLVICDLAMPGMDGIQLLRALDARDLHPCVLLVGGQDDRLRAAAEYVAQSMGFLVLGALAKPLDPEQLAPALGRMDHLAPPAPATPAARDLDEDVLRRGIDGDALQLLYLPKVSLAGRRVIGAEALVRWESGDLYRTDDLLRRVQNLGLAERLTEVVLHKAFAQAGEWRAEGVHTELCVNVFASLLRRPDFCEEVIAGAEAEGVNPQDVILDISEAGLQGYGREELETLVSLRLRGVGLAVDDFGVGAFSLEELRRVPVSEVKIDTSLVAAAGRERVAHAVVQSTTTLARELGLRSVAEGVEDRAAWELVRDLGADLAQGYHISPPLPGAEFPAWRERWQAGGGSGPGGRGG